MTDTEFKYIPKFAAAEKPLSGRTNVGLQFIMRML
jgi:hypothetical protein